MSPNQHRGMEPAARSCSSTNRCTVVYPEWVLRRARMSRTTGRRIFQFAERLSGPAQRHRQRDCSGRSWVASGSRRLPSPGREIPEPAPLGPHERRRPRALAKEQKPVQASACSSRGSIERRIHQDALTIDRSGLPDCPKVLMGAARRSAPAPGSRHVASRAGRGGQPRHERPAGPRVATTRWLPGAAAAGFVREPHH